MSTFKAVISAMKDVLPLTDKGDRAGKVLSDFSNELRDHDQRLITLETMAGIAKCQPRLTDESKKKILTISNR